MAPTTVDLLNKAVVLELRFGRPGSTRRVSSDLIEVDADKNLVHVDKKILDSPEAKAVTTHDHKTSARVARMALPAEELGRGFHLIAKGVLKPLWTYLKGRERQRQELVRQDVAAYPRRKEESIAKLKSLADEENYPTVEAYRDAYYMEWRTRIFGVPDILSDIDPEILAEEQQKAQDDQVGLSQGIVIANRENFIARLDAIVGELAEKDDESGFKKIYDTVFEAWTEYLDLFPAQNLAADDELKGLVDRATKAMLGVTLKDLRDKTKAQARRDLYTDLRAIQADTAKAALLSRPKRAISVAA